LKQGGRASRPSQIGGCDSYEDVACHCPVVHTQSDSSGLIAPDVGKQVSK